MARFTFLKSKRAADARQATANTVIAPLAGGADLPTTVAKVNAVIAALKAGGYIG